MPSAEEHLQQHMGAMIASLMVQIALLKAEIDRLRAEPPVPEPGLSVR